MSTNDVPGAKASNNDTLAMGCWAEHEDGSLIFVQGNENGRVIFSIFDMSKEPAIEWRDSMAEVDFMSAFSWNGQTSVKVGKGKDKKDIPAEKWTWHDKTPFPWDNIIKRGAKDGRIQTADEILTAAERVAKNLKVRGEKVDREAMSHMADRAGLGGMLHRLGDALDKLGV
jgi:hypothetical protein